MGLALLHELPEPLWIALLQVLQAFPAMLLNLVLGLLIRFRICLFEMRETLTKFGLALLDGLLERFGIFLLQLPQLLNLLR